LCKAHDTHEIIHSRRCRTTIQLAPAIGGILIVNKGQPWAIAPRLLHKQQQHWGRGSNSNSHCTVRVHETALPWQTLGMGLSVVQCGSSQSRHAPCCAEINQGRRPRRNINGLPSVGIPNLPTQLPPTQPHRRTLKHPRALPDSGHMARSPAPCACSKHSSTRPPHTHALCIPAMQVSPSVRHIPDPARLIHSGSAYQSAPLPKTLLVAQIGTRPIQQTPTQHVAAAPEHAVLVARMRIQTLG